ncbi:MAG: hypothetical protein HUJ76_05075, partial [Parasporobacterium sp.]|nr:hypothetical protein [Parasporobacterium sp.]
ETAPADKGKIPVKQEKSPDAKKETPAAKEKAPSRGLFGWKRKKSADRKENTGAETAAVSAVTAGTVAAAAAVSSQSAPEFDLESFINSELNNVKASAASPVPEFDLESFIDPGKTAERTVRKTAAAVQPDSIPDFSRFINPDRKIREENKASVQPQSSGAVSPGNGINISRDPELDLSRFINADPVKKPAKEERKQFSFDELFGNRIKNHKPDAKPVALKFPLGQAPQREYSLTEDQKSALADYLAIKGMEDEICAAIESIVIRKKSGDETGGHLIVTGDGVPDKTALVIAVLKAVNKEAGSGNARVAKVEAKAINGKNIKKVLARVEDSDLIIENIGKLEDDTVNDLIAAVRESSAPTLVVLQGNKLAADNLILNFPDIRKIFRTRIDICEHNEQQGRLFSAFTK